MAGARALAQVCSSPGLKMRLRDMKLFVPAPPISRREVPPSAHPNAADARDPRESVASTPVPGEMMNDAVSSMVTGMRRCGLLKM